MKDQYNKRIMKMENIQYGLISSQYGYKYHLKLEWESLGYVLIKHNSHPKGWSIARKHSVFDAIHFSSSLKRLDKYISFNKLKLRGENND